MSKQAFYQLNGYAAGLPLEYSHSLADQIGGQTAAGFHIIDLYEDHFKDYIIGKYMPNYIATLAIKP